MSKRPWTSDRSSSDGPPSKLARTKVVLQANTAHSSKLPMEVFDMDGGSSCGCNMGFLLLWLGSLTVSASYFALERCCDGCIHCSVLLCLFANRVYFVVDLLMSQRKQVKRSAISVGQSKTSRAKAMPLSSPTMCIVGIVGVVFVLHY